MASSNHRKFIIQLSQQCTSHFCFWCFPENWWMLHTETCWVLLLQWYRQNRFLYRNFEVFLETSLSCWFSSSHIGQICCLSAPTCSSLSRWVSIHALGAQTSVPYDAQNAQTHLDSPHQEHHPRSALHPKEKTFTTHKPKQSKCIVWKQIKSICCTGL